MRATPTVTPDVIQEMAARIVERFQPEKIILFGSHASGRADDQSDVDLLVVGKTDLPDRERYPVFRRALADFPVACDILVKTPQEYERQRVLVNHITYFADRYGKVLYERPPA
jgi:predicted nucleotidyltransferase